MRHRHAVLLVLLLAQVISPAAFAQRTDAVADTSSQQGEVRGVSLEQNYPNPFRTETRIPFELGADLFEEGRSVVVSVRVFNLLGQHIATPILIDHPTAANQPALNVAFDRPGRYEVLWDGRDGSGRQVSSGIYFCEVRANSARDLVKMLVSR